uniref:(northern house mosquito) hypothetical protein n=1 Tax=Culex pipiens TaxID=7175 RepID=A0A8D8ACV4_CULPI
MQQRRFRQRFLHKSTLSAIVAETSCQALSCTWACLYSVLLLSNRHGCFLTADTNAMLNCWSSGVSLVGPMFFLARSGGQLCVRDDQRVARLRSSVLGETFFRTRNSQNIFPSIFPASNHKHFTNN